MRKVLIPLDGENAGLLGIESLCALSVKIESFSAPGCGANEGGVDSSGW